MIHKKVAFIGNAETPKTLLNLWRRQTPGCRGIWGELEGVDNYADADCFVVIDRLPGGLGIDTRKCVFLGTHPEGHSGYAELGEIPCLARTDVRKEPGLLEWWINYDYDTLKQLRPPSKENPLGCIVSDTCTHRSHEKRRSWLRRFTEREGLDFNLHGRIVPFSRGMAKYYRGPCGSADPRGAASSNGNDHMSGKEAVYLRHKYMVEFDVVGENYFSERILDAMLLWAMPIYSGCPNLHKHLPADSFRYFNIDGDGSDVLTMVSSGFYEQNLPALAEARDVLLDRRQLWPCIHRLIFGEPTNAPNPTILPND